MSKKHKDSTVGRILGSSKTLFIHVVVEERETLTCACGVALIMDGAPEAKLITVKVVDTEY